MNANIKSTTTLSRTDVTENEETPVQPRRMAAQRATNAAPKFFTPKIAALLLAILLAGATFGIVITRQRYKARQVVIAVNGELINQNDLYNQLERTAGVSAIKTILDEKLALQFAKQKDAMPTREEIDKRYQEMLAQPGYQEQLKQSGRLPVDVKHELMVKMAKAKIFEKGVTVTEEEIRRFYETNLDKKTPTARYYTPETIQLAVIVTKTEADALKAKADLAHNIPFGTVAQTYSIDDSKQSGGMTGLIIRGRTQAAKMPGFEDTVFKIKIGSQVGPVNIANVWWIIRCMDKTLEKTLTYNAVHDECRIGAILLKGVKQNKAKVEAEYAEFRKKSNVQAFWPQYKDAVDQR